MAAWDVTSAIWSQLFDVSGEEDEPTDVFFKPDGTKMYVIGVLSYNVNEYNLSVAWDVTSASFLQLFDVSGEESHPEGLFFKPDGTKMYVIGRENDEINEYNLSTAWNISTASWLQLFSVTSEESSPRTVFFKPDGTKMYVTGAGSIAVNEYDLSVAWDVTSASWLQLFSVASEETLPKGLFFKPDGTKMYVIGSQNDSVYEYNLSVAWDVTSASFLQLKSVASEETTPHGIFFKPDGTKMYVIGSIGDDVNEYVLPANIEINVDDVWKDIIKAQINVGDVWKTVIKAQINIGDDWKDVFG